MPLFEQVEASADVHLLLASADLSLRRSQETDDPNARAALRDMALKDARRAVHLLEALS